MPHKIYEATREKIWLDHVPVSQKIYGSWMDLQSTVALTKETGESIAMSNYIRSRSVLLTVFYFHFAYFRIIGTSVAKKMKPYLRRALLTGYYDKVFCNFLLMTYCNLMTSQKI
ncbi:hypothetical protein PoB_004134900 [Plakobranchus ocellatus]|uniref:Uncharacterized protein n=1 Tax=Plakobranchus ocellatus TaxID=259542 RepID=A0AAV4B829_9GAST|nr:hypothetical protein PoB_004134900 [Plakobranchus ocellatus]